MGKGMKLRSIIKVLLICSMPLPAHAYLDPSTGIALINSTSGLLFFLLLIFTKGYQYFIGFTLIRKEIKLSEKFDVIYHCEHFNYLKVFYFSLALNKNKKILVLGPPKIKEFLSKKINFRNCRFIEAETLFYQASALMLLKSDIVLTSTTQLNVGYFHKAKNIKKWIHIMHSPVDLHNFDLLSFDHFDEIFTSNIYIKKNLEKLFIIRKIEKKPKVFFLSLQYYLYYKKFERHNVSSSKQKTFLIAPTWGRTGLLYQLNEKILESIYEVAIQMNLSITFRPHVQSHISDKEKIAYIDNFFKKRSVCYNFETTNSNIASMLNAKVMLSDYSGVICDYHFINKKPISICFFNFKEIKEKSAKEAVFLSGKPFEYYLYQKFTCLVTSQVKLEGAIKSSPNLLPKRISSEKLFFNIKEDYRLKL